MTLDRCPSCNGVINPDTSECRCSGGVLLSTLTLIVIIALSVLAVTGHRTHTVAVTPPACAHALTVTASQVALLTRSREHTLAALTAALGGHHGRAMALAARVEAVGAFTVPGGCH